MSLFTQIDLSELPPPTIIEEIDYQTILEATKTELQNIAPDFPVNELLESDPMSKLLEVIAYREMHLRQRINEAARGLMLATATGADLDNLVALLNIVRAKIDDGDPDQSPPVPPTFEDDDRLRARAQLAFEGFSTAGPKGAYVFHALSADARVKDVTVYSEKPGVVDVRILSREDNGEASQGLVTVVESALNDGDVRPITDFLHVSSADIVEHTVNVNLTLYPGVGIKEVLAATEQGLKDYMQKHHALGVDITRSGLFAAADGVGVQNVELIDPKQDIPIDRGCAAFGRLGSLTHREYPSQPPAALAAGIDFPGVEKQSTIITGTVLIHRAEDEFDIDDYVLYWGGSNAEKLPLGAKAYTVVDGLLTLDHADIENLYITSEDGKTIYVIERDFKWVNGNTLETVDQALNNITVKISYRIKPIAVLSKKKSDVSEAQEKHPLVFEFAKDTAIAQRATHLLVFTRNAFGEMSEGLAASIYK